MLAGGNEKFPPANILSFLPSHYNDYHAFVSSTEHGFFRILGEMSLRGQEKTKLMGHTLQIVIMDMSAITIRRKEIRIFAMIKKRHWYVPSLP